MTELEMFRKILPVLTDAEQIEFVETKIAALEERAAKTKARNDAKKAESDELRERIFNCLTDEPKTLQTILEELDEEGLTIPKIVPRMTQLVNTDRAEKIEVKVEGGKKMGYRLYADGAI